MREMCRNFACNQHCRQNNAEAASATLTPATMIGNCNACVLEQIGPAQAMVPFQPYEAPMEAEQSLICGTVFADLAIPYCSGWNLSERGQRYESGGIIEILDGA